MYLCVRVSLLVSVSQAVFACVSVRVSVCQCVRVSLRMPVSQAVFACASVRVEVCMLRARKGKLLTCNDESSTVDA